MASFKLKPHKLGHVGVKESVFPFARFPGVDTVLGPEMKSTGEVMGIDRSFEIAFAKSQLGGGTRVPRKGTVFVSVREIDKTRILDAVRLLSSVGFRVIATSGTQRYLADNGVPTEKINKVLEGRPHIVDAITNGEVVVVVSLSSPSTGTAIGRPRSFNADLQAQWETVGLIVGGVVVLVFVAGIVRNVVVGRRRAAAARAAEGDG